jgi:hypothetical protein
MKAIVSNYKVTGATFETIIDQNITVESNAFLKSATAKKLGFSS